MVDKTTNSNLVSMAQAFTGLPMDDLIGGPLNAAARANASMAQTQTQFLLSTCFSKGEEDNNYTPIMVKMILTRGAIVPVVDGDGNETGEVKVEKIETSFDLPILTIIPLNSLAVDSVDITFEMEVKSSFGEESSQTAEQAVAASTEWEAKFKIGPFSTSIKGNASYESKDMQSFNSHYEKSNTAKYTVNVHAGQLPLPKGVDVIINAFTDAITPYEIPKRVTAQPADTSTKPTEPVAKTA